MNILVKKNPGNPTGKRLLVNLRTIGNRVPVTWLLHPDRGQKIDVLACSPVPTVRLSRRDLSDDLWIVPSATAHKGRRIGWSPVGPIFSDQVSDGLRLLTIQLTPKDDGCYMMVQPSSSCLRVVEHDL